MLKLHQTLNYCPLKLKLFQAELLVGAAETGYHYSMATSSNSFADDKKQCLYAQKQ